MLELVDDWGIFIDGQIAERDVSLLRRHECTGRSLGGESFIGGLERALSAAFGSKNQGQNPIEEQEWGNSDEDVDIRGTFR